MAITASYGFAGTLNEAQWSELHVPLANPGFVNGMSQTVGSGTREVDLASGTAYAVGTYHVASATTVALSANGSGNPRIDTIVVNIDFTTDSASITAVEGTPASSPVPPTLTQTAGVEWEVPICDVLVDDGATTFSTADFTDRCLQPFTGRAGLNDILVEVGTTTINETISYGTTFPSIPFTLATTDNSLFSVAVDNWTTSGCRLILRRISGTAEYNVKIAWFAVAPLWGDWPQ